MKKKNINSKVKKMTAFLLVLSVVLLGTHGIPSTVSEADTQGAQKNVLRATSGVSASFDKNCSLFGSVLNTQMTNYLNNNANAEMAEVMTNRVKEGMNSTITFDFEKSNFKNIPIPISAKEANDRIMRWLNTAISEYPSLCSLYSQITYAYTVDNDNNRYLASVTVYSPLEAGQIKDITLKYSKELSELVKVPKSDYLMKTQEKVLYIHDKIVTMADYGTGEDYEEYLPIGVLLNHKGVCQSYAHVMNQALTELNIDSIYLVSKNHAWNAVRIYGKWYYVDATWDDPVGDVPISFVSHEYFLVNPTKLMTGDHEMSSEYSDCYGTILKTPGSDYDSYLPKVKDANGRSRTRSFDYLNGVWYYSDRSNLYTWDGESSVTTIFNDVSAGTPEVCSAVYDGALYYSTPLGIYKYEKIGTDKLIVSGNVTAFVYRGSVLEYQIDGKSPVSLATPTPSVEPTPTNDGAWEEPLVSATPVITAAPTGGSQTPGETIIPLVTQDPLSTNRPATLPPAATAEPPQETEKPIVRPAQGAVTQLTNYIKGKIRVTVKKINSASGYQIYYSTDKKFNKNVKMKYTQSVKSVIKKLKKKTYYVKVRAYVTEKNGEKLYGSFSKVKKIKVKK